MIPHAVQRRRRYLSIVHGRTWAQRGRFIGNEAIHANVLWRRRTGLRTAQRVSGLRIIMRQSRQVPRTDPWWERWLRAQRSQSRHFRLPCPLLAFNYLDSGPGGEIEETASCG
jgi:hypothetical protein